MTNSVDPVPSWGTCSFCGDAVPFGSKACPTCGDDRPVSAHDFSKLPKRLQRKMRIISTLRVVLVVAVIVGVAYAILSAVVTGPPVIADPLTTSQTLSAGPGNFSYLSGLITGEDYIIGNYTVMDPLGALVTFNVFNSTEFQAYAHHQPAQSQWAVSAQTTGRIIFAAPYTDTFFLVFSNPYLPVTHLGIQVYVSTNYVSNVVLG